MIAIIDYGLGNLSSVKYALDRLGEPCALTSDPAEIAAAAGVILPGVGAIGQAMERLRQMELLAVTRQAALSGRPFLGICLGLQLLFSHSEEHGGHDGLDIIKGRTTRFPRGLTVPHMGWNQVRQDRPSPLFEGIADQSFFYFAHSYYVVPEQGRATIGTSEYGGDFTSAVQQEMVFGVQFHPEKSSRPGAAMLRNFCRLCSPGREGD